MPDFYKQYRFADNDAPVQDWDHFLNIRIGAQLIKDTGDKFEKVADHVYDKVARRFLSSEDIEGKFALLHATNTFTDPQYCTATPTEPYHITNKEYVDACIATAQVDLSGFGRLDRENIWKQPQICNAEPKNPTHLTNKAYVDDRINEIEFDTTSLARLNSPNVFTAPQSCAVESTAPEHFVTKQYVDDTRTQIIDNISGFVRADLPNTFTATQTFQYTTIVPTPQTDTEAANKLYVDTKVTETQQRLGKFAALDQANTFERDQTFRGNLIANLAPSQPYHLVNKEYIDAILQGFQLPDNIASTDVEQTWTASQNFVGGISVPYPDNDDDAATKSYVDRVTQTLRVADASTTDKGIVQLTKPISTSGAEGTQSVEEFAQNTTTVPTPKDVADYVTNVSEDSSDYARLSASNVFTGDSNQFNGLIASNIDAESLSLTRKLAVSGESTFSRTILSSIANGSIISLNRSAQIQPSGATAYTINVTGTYDSYDIAVGTSPITDEESPTLGFPKGTTFLPEFGNRISIDAGYDIEFGSAPLTPDSNSWVIGTRFAPLIVSESDSPGKDLVIQPQNTIIYMGIIEKIDEADKTNTKLYPGSNVTTPFTNATDGLVSTKYLLGSPWVENTADRIELISKQQETPASKYEFYRGIVQNSTDGSLKVSIPNFITAVENKWLTGNIKVTGFNGINIASLDASGLVSIELSNLNSAVININHAKHLVLSNTTNIALNTVNSTTIVNGASGTINASKNSHVILKTSSAEVNLTWYSTCDDTLIQCEGTADATSVFYTKGPTKKMVTITFDAAGGTPTPASLEVESGTTWADIKSRVSNPTRQYYKFTCWSLESDDPTPVQDSYQFTDSQTTLYAQWQYNGVDIQFEEQGGSAVRDLKVVKGTTWATVKSKVGSTERKDYEFKWWSTSQDGAAIKGSYVFNNDIERLWAVWESTAPRMITITFDSTGGQPEQDPIQVEEGSLWRDIKGKVTNPSRSGKTFKGWSVKGS